MALHPSVSLSNHYYRHIHRHQNHHPQSSNFSSIPLLNSTSKTTENSISFSRRTLGSSILALILNVISPNTSTTMAMAMVDQELELERYTDFNEGFTLLKPNSWITVDKAGATALFEEPNKGSNNVGVVVNPVRLNSLGQFGTPQFVAEKVIQAEKLKESTMDAELVGTSERVGEGGLQVYEFEYKIDSTRGGIKRVFSAAFVASKKLYLLNITHSDKPESS